MPTLQNQLQPRRARLRPSFWLVLATVAMANGCFGSDCTGNNTFPETCDVGGSVAGVTGLEVGIYVNEVFTPISDEDVVDLVYGGQGAAMVPVALRVTGTDLPGCMPQSTTIYDDQNESIGSEDQSIETHVDGAMRATNSLYVILGFSGYEGMRARIESTVGSQTVSRIVHLSFVDFVDAGAPADAEPSLGDANPTDAATGADASPTVDAGLADAAVDDAAN